MSEHKLAGKRIAVLVADGFEQSEMTEPRKALQAAGAEVDLVSISSGPVRGMTGKSWDEEFTVDVRVDDVATDNYDGLVLPGGVINPDLLRVNDRAVAFVRAFFMAKKPVGAICHGPWTLAEAGVLEGRRVTSYPSIKTDLKNAGADWVDEEVVVDNGLVTSRSPEDLEAFNAKLIEEFAEGKHAHQQAVA